MSAAAVPASAAATPAPVVPVTFFLSGVMGGSGKGTTTAAGGIRMESQDYRARVRSAVLKAFPQACIVDPLALGKARAEQLFPEGTPADQRWARDSDVRDMFESVVAEAAAAHVVVCYLPSASMGSAVEIAAAHAAGKRIYVVAPGVMRQNWVVRAYADAIFETVAELGTFLMQVSETLLEDVMA